MKKISSDLIQKHNYNYLIILGFCGIVLLRIVPHVANMVPVFALLTAFIINHKISKLVLTLLMLGAIFTSDLLLSAMHGYPIIGAYSLFTYSGFVLVIALNFKLIKMPVALLVNTVIATIVYWLWTNFGVWVAEGMYSMDLAGVSLCYTMALPFLKYSLLANTVGGVLFAANIYPKYPFLSLPPATRVNSSVDPAN